MAFFLRENCIFTDDENKRDVAAHTLSNVVEGVQEAAGGNLDDGGDWFAQMKQALTRWTQRLDTFC